MPLTLFRLRDVLPQIPNVLFRKRLRFRFEQLPFEARDLSWMKRLNFFVAGLNQFLLPSRPLGYPVIAQVEPSNVCNLSCSLCLSASLNNSRKPAMLPLSTFKHLIDEVGDRLLLIVLWNWGEPFLNPEITEMIAYATSRGILVHSSTNGNVLFDDSTAGRIVDSGLTSLVFGVDGATQETYGRYRIGGDLERVKANIRTLIGVRSSRSAAHPRIVLRFVVMRQNEHELPLAEELARDLGVDFFSIKSVDTPSPIGPDLDRDYRPEQARYCRYDYVDGTNVRKRRPFRCMRPWKRITLDAMGEVISCEYDYRDLHSFGNISDGRRVLDVWKGDGAAAFRRRFNVGHNDYYHCGGCSYKDLRTAECILSASPVKPSEPPSFRP